MIKAFCCLECGNLLSDLTQKRQSPIQPHVKIEGYCEKCATYSGFNAMIEDDSVAPPMVRDWGFDEGYLDELDAPESED